MFMIKLKIQRWKESPWRKPFSAAMYLVQKSIVIADKRKLLYCNLTMQLTSYDTPYLSVSLRNQYKRGIKRTRIIPDIRTLFMQYVVVSLNDLCCDSFLLYAQISHWYQA